MGEEIGENKDRIVDNRSIQTVLNAVQLCVSVFVTLYLCVTSNFLAL